jgi:hypothetical protein
MAYTCSLCGDYVHEGFVHSCGPFQLYPPITNATFTAQPFGEVDRQMLREIHEMLTELKRVMGWAE